MFFSICEHYYDYSSNETHSIIYNENCYICYEIKCINNEYPIYLENQKLYNNICKCNIILHNYCLKHFINLNKKCPICRINVIVFNNNSKKFLLYFIFYFYLYYVIYFTIFTIDYIILKDKYI